MKAMIHQSTLEIVQGISPNKRSPLLGTQPIPPWQVRRSDGAIHRAGDPSSSRTQIQYKDAYRIGCDHEWWESKANM
jgi:hypothetical protein